MINSDNLIGTELRNDDDTPNVATMKAELMHACENSRAVFEKMTRNENVRYAIWDGQQEDGRKPDTVDGREADPWPGASDVRVRLADELVNDHVKMMKAAARRATFNMVSTKGATYESAGRVKAYLNYLRNTRMRLNVRREVELAAQWRQTQGIAAMSITWDQEWAREYQTVTTEQLQQQAAMEPGSPAAQILAALYEPDPDVTRQVAGMLRQMYADLDQGDALKQINALRRTGQMSLPARYLRRNEPRWKARKWFRDAFGPLNMGELQRSPWVCIRETLTKAQAQEKVISEGWSQDFVTAIVAKAGRSVLDILQQNLADSERRRLFGDSTELMHGLCEVFYFYYTHADEDGVPCKYLTVMSPHVDVDDQGEPLYGLDQPYGYDHGEYPIVEMRRERAEEQFVESRSVPDLVITQQAEVKSMRDARVNQTDLFLQPPMIRPEREIGLSLTIRPRGEIGERRAQSTRAMEIPNTAPAGQPLEDAARLDAYRYFARNRAEDPVRAGVYDQDLADSWCEELEECWSQTLKLAQQFETKAEFSRIVGGNPVEMQISREDIQGEFDFTLQFNADSMDPERIEKKAELLQAVVMPLAGGAVDPGPIVRGLAGYFFPEFADDALRDPSQAAEAEIADEQQNWTKMMSGTEPEMVDKGQNFQLRLNWLQNQLQQPGSQKRLAQHEDSRDLVEQRLQHLQFMVKQFTTNAQTGRVGVQAGPTAA